MKEIWKVIEEFGEGRYSVSNLSNVRNNETNKLIIGDINNMGYYRVQLHYKGKKKRFMRHILVAKYFIENHDENRKFVNHKDGNKSHNYQENLEWCTQSENEKHAFRNGLKRKTNKPFEVLFENGEVKQYESQNELMLELNVSQGAVTNWLCGKAKPSRKHNIKRIYYI